MTGLLDRTYGLVRSMLIYYGQVWRGRSLERFYAQFVAPGDLCFDVGAHVGNRTRAWRRLGARVVAIEPQPDFGRILRRLFEGDPNVTLLDCALGDAPGETTLRISTRNPTVTSISKDWIDRVSRDPGFSAVRWDREQRVAVHTLDEMIAEHGAPAFCKIDVEGAEHLVLAGLSQPLKGISFEYIPSAVDLAMACMDRIDALGRYEFRSSEAETMAWTQGRWMDCRAMRAYLRSRGAGHRSGDVYARLQA